MTKKRRSSKFKPTTVFIETRVYEGIHVRIEKFIEPQPGKIYNIQFFSDILEFGALRLGVNCLVEEDLLKLPSVAKAVHQRVVELIQEDELRKQFWSDNHDNPYVPS